MALEARVACPFCDGPIHPVAGRCKHCKEDLAAARAARPPAQAPLPPLAGPSPAAVAALAATYLTPAPADGASPILPPRPTGSRAAVEPGSVLRSWPVVVIGLATIAIIAAVAILVWPAGKPGGERLPSAKPPPAPDRMDTDPQPKADPWNHAQDRADPRPTAEPRLAPPLDPPQILPGPPGSDDTLAQLGPGAADLALAVMTHACARLAECPDADDTAREFCKMVSQYSGSVKVPQCDSAKECLQEIDNLDCDKAASPASLLSTIPSCVAAASSC